MPFSIRESPFHKVFFIYSARRLVVMVLKDAQFSVMGVAADVIARVDHKALLDVILGFVQSGRQGPGVR